MTQNEKFNFNFFMKIGFLKFLFILSSIDVWAAKSCRLTFEPQTQFERALMGEKIDNFDLLIEFENLWNRSEFRRSVQLVEIPFTEIKKDSLIIEYYGTEEENQQIAKLLTGKRGQKRWFKHPFNTASIVPYFYEPNVDSIKGYLSASRTIFFKLGEKHYSMRMPTDHALGPKKVADLAKTQIAPELELASLQMQQIEKVDQLLKTPPQLILAKELAVVKTVDPKRTKDILFEKSGFLIRNLNFLENKNRFYMPALALPEAGKMISFAQGKKFSEYWMKSYAEALGVVKAQLLIHYGLQMEFPHGQNILIELDENMKPTGRFVLRDIDDMSQNSSVVDSINQALFEHNIEPLKLNQNNASGAIDLHWSRHSSRVISHSEDSEVYSEKIDDKWEKAHELAFAKEVARLLGVRPNEVGNNANQVQILLNSTWGQGLVRNYFLNQLVSTRKK